MLLCNHEGNTFQKVKLLGRGTYADVLLVRNEENRESVVKLSRDKSIQAIRSLNNEFEKLKAIETSGFSPRPIEYHRELDDTPAMEIEFKGGETLRKFIDYYEHRTQKLDDIKLVNICLRLVSILSSLHREYKIAHFDLSPDNFIMDRESQNITLIDYSLAKLESEFSEIKRIAGKKEYLAPETFDNEFGFFNDVYALGKICTEIAGLIENKILKKEMINLFQGMMTFDFSKRDDLSLVKLDLMAKKNEMKKLKIKRWSYKVLGLFLGGIVFLYLL